MENTKVNPSLFLFENSNAWSRKSNEGRRKLTNFLLSTLNFISFFFVCFHFILGSYDFALILLTNLICFGVLHWLHYKGHEIIARVGLLVVGNFLIFMYSSLYGPDAGTYFLFFPMVALSFILNDMEYRYIFYSIPFLSLVLYAILHLTNHSLFLYTGGNLPASEFNYHFNLIVSFFYCLASIFYIKWETQISNKTVSENEARLKKLIDSARESIWSVGADFRLKYLNQNFMENFQSFAGVELQIGDRMLDFLDGEELKFWQQINLRAQMGKTFEVEREYFYNNKHRHVELRVTPSFSSDQSFEGFTIVSRDITAKKQAELDKSEASARFENLINSVEGIVWEYNYEKGKYNFVSKKAEQLLGYPVDQWLDEENFWERRIYEGDRGWLIPYFDESVHNFASFSLEYRMRDSLNEIVWLKDMVTVKLKHGKPHLLQGVMVDITEQKRSEEQVSRLGNMLKLVTENMPLILLSFSHEGKILSALGSGFELMGIDENVLPGTNIKGILPEFPLEDISSISIKPLVFETSRLEEGSDWCFEIYVIKDGHGAYIALGRDISERKKIEGKLKSQNELLEKANVELDRFVYSTTHDLRAPLMSVMGLMQLIEFEKDEDTKKSYFDMMKNRIEKLDNFIKDIIQFAKSTRMESKFEKVDIQDMVCEIFEGVRYLDGADRIHLEFDISENTPIVTDKNRLNIVLNNLVTNAVKYHNIRKSDPFVKVEVHSGEEHYSLSVKDNGTGIPEENQDKIFDMFYRATTTSTGSGLGLYIVKELVDKMNGRIEMSSKWGEGTTFTLYIPNKSQQQKKNLVLEPMS